ncbi:MAG: sterol desaturase family protein [Gemmatimonadota bacterium]
MPQETLLAAVWLALLWLAEATIPMVEGYEKRVPHALANLAIGILNAVVTSLLLAGGALAVTEWARVHGFGLLHMVRLPEVAMWIAAILLMDLWQYTWHRINHRIPLLWRFHAVHHSDAEMDATSGVRFHTVEILLSGVARLAVLPLLGLTIPQLALYETLALPVILFHHSNIRLAPTADRLLRAVIVTPAMHRVHHSRWQPETDSNYSSLFSFWDRFLGSFRLRDDPAEIALGLDGYEESEWRELPGMLRSPFRKRRRPGEETPSEE